MATKKGIEVGGGGIDADYTGEVKVILRNHGEADCVFKAGDRIAQLIIEKVANADAMGSRQPRDNRAREIGLWVERSKP